MILVAHNTIHVINLKKGYNSSPSPQPYPLPCNFGGCSTLWDKLCNLLWATCQKMRHKQKHENTHAIDLALSHTHRTCQEEGTGGTEPQGGCGWQSNTVTSVVKHGLLLLNPKHLFNVRGLAFIAFPRQKLWNSGNFQSSLPYFLWNTKEYFLLFLNGYI